MKKEEIQGLITGTPVGDGIKISIPEDRDVKNFRLHIFRAAQYGIIVKLVKLYDTTYYLEKTDEGDLEAYKKSISTKRGNHNSNKINTGI